MTSRCAARRVPIALLLLAVAGMVGGAAQTPPERLREAIDRLGDFDYTARMEASRAVRRADPRLAGPLLREALEGHDDSYVQFRALVLLYGLAAPQTAEAMAAALDSPNDRVRAAAYGYFEYAPDPAVAARLLAALERETSEFVRPALVRALAAHDDDAAVRDRLVRDVDRGETYFRAVVIEALGDHRAGYAVDALLAVAAEPGSLQDDALLALGRIGDRRAAGVVTAARAGAPDRLQPVVSAAACLLAIDCDSQVPYIVAALRYGAQAGADDDRELLRNAAAGLAALAAEGNGPALDALFDAGRVAGAAAQAPIALALGTVALRRPGVVLQALADRGAPDEVPEAELLLLRDAFDMLDEDLAEERFQAHLRRAYWAGGEGSAVRAAAEAALRVLEF